MAVVEGCWLAAAPPLLYRVNAMRARHPKKDVEIALAEAEALAGP